MLLRLLSLTTFLTAQYLFAQNASIQGTVFHKNEPIVGAAIYIQELGKGVRTNSQGSFLITNLKSGTYSIRATFTGYKTTEKSISLNDGEEKNILILLEEDFFNTNDVVVTATRNRIRKQDAPVVVNTISKRTFEATQSLSLAEGLSFSPGLRLENNCQNCGFTQLRMNGLDGPYSQILINSRPIFSALAGVYGLEMLPANMVDRIEIIRGGGSVLYGGNAIAGTVNVITKDPIENSFEVGLNQAFTNFQESDRTLTFNASLVSEDFKKGITIFGMNRERNPWDANQDGFSELTALKNTTFGFDAFWNLAARSKIKFNLFTINEFRRGGSDFNLEPHQSRLAEKLQHNILSINASFEHYSKNYKHKFAIYQAVQWVDRESYYGAGGSILNPGDSLTQDILLALNAYGQSNDFSSVTGLQYNYEINTKLQLTSGTELNINQVKDQMPGYQRSIQQQVSTLGTYVQLEYKPLAKLTLLTGARFDYLDILGEYQLAGEKFNNDKKISVLIPRITLMYQIHKFWKLRSSFAQGYRGPQAFDEDLHIETVGGAARFILLDQELKTERSNSANFSLNFEKMLGSLQATFLAEAFYTELNNPFILSNQVELPSGVSVITKRNGSGAKVFGTNLEANIAYKNKWILQGGITIQRANYADVEVLWSPENSSDPTPQTTTKLLLRTPNNYGFLTFTYNPDKRWSFSYAAVYTGKMLIPHVINPETEQTVIKKTDQFFESNFKISYKVEAKDKYHIQFFTGIQNMFNSFQRDFDTGQFRDAGYVYGPIRPRTLFFGLKFGFN